ncbi:MAG: TetR/AcrR family transcriptional regulator [Pseudomonadota bacterium]|nr:TetR/AcrR family transcriptional regulator [Pseudomonadota bacterium]
MPRKPAHERFDTLKAIQEHAFALFGRFGYEGVSIGDIAKHAKLSKGALYWHYSGKESLFLECLQRLHAIFNQHIFDPMDAQNDAVPRILQLFEGLRRFLDDPRVQRGIAGFWLIPSRPETARFIDAQTVFETRARDIIEQTLRLGAQQGQFDLGSDVEDMSRAIIALVEAVVLPMRHQSPDEVQRILAVLARTLFRAYAGNEDLIGLTRSL